MKFLLDEDIYAVTIRFLKELGYDVALASQIGVSPTEDSSLLKIAKEQRRIFMTRDRDFGRLVFVESLSTGVIYLRMLPSTQYAVHQELKGIFNSYSEDELKNAFIVVEPGRHRFRRLSVKIGS